MTDLQLSETGPLPDAMSKRVVVPIALVLVCVFVIVLFPWDTLARRVAWEISIASGANVSITSISPALTARGPGLRASNVVIEHPAIDRLRVSELEIAPRRLLEWLTGTPHLRVWAESDLGQIDGVLGLGSDTSFDGDVQRVELSRLPLRLEASDVRFDGFLDGTADVLLARDGTLRGTMVFESTSLVVESGLLPMPIPFSRADGEVEILENGATRIKSLSLEGEILDGTLSGEIGLVHRSLAPPIDLELALRVRNGVLRQMAVAGGLPISANGELDVRVGGTLDVPSFQNAGQNAGANRPRAAARRARRSQRAANAARSQPGRGR